MKPEDKARYESNAAKFAGTFNADVAKEAADLVNKYLLVYGDPKEYSEYRQMAIVVSQAIVLWAVSEHKLSLRKVATADQAEQDAKALRIMELNMAIADLGKDRPFEGPLL